MGVFIIIEFVHAKAKLIIFYFVKFERSKRFSDKFTNLKITFLQNTANLSIFASFQLYIQPYIGRQLPNNSCSQRTILDSLNFYRRIHFLHFLWSHSSMHFHLISSKKIISRTLQILF